MMNFEHGESGMTSTTYGAEGATRWKFTHCLTPFEGSSFGLVRMILED